MSMSQRMNGLNSSKWLILVIAILAAVVFFIAFNWKVALAYVVMTVVLLVVVYAKQRKKGS
jgi:hypothetical protein